MRDGDRESRKGSGKSAPGKAKGASRPARGGASAGRKKAGGKDPARRAAGRKAPARKAGVAGKPTARGKAGGKKAVARAGRGRAPKRERRLRWQARARTALRASVIASIAFLLLAAVTVAGSWGRPPALAAELVRVDSLPSGEVLVYGVLRGTFGPFRRGFGQRVGAAHLDLVDPEGRFLTLEGEIEESAWQAYLWPPNWFRREIWFSEALPGLEGFATVRVRLRDGLGHERVSVSLPVVGGESSRSPDPPELPWDVEPLAVPGAVWVRALPPLAAADVELETPLR